MARIAPEELGRLYREHAGALRLYARQWPEGDEDLVQDAFVKLAQQSPPPEQVLPWQGHSRPGHG
jgi:RNA polymerase sigma-70 factor (ECF subfamily)